MTNLVKIFLVSEYNNFVYNEVVVSVSTKIPLTSFVQPEGSGPHEAQWKVFHCPI